MPRPKPAEIHYPIRFNDTSAVSLGSRRIGFTELYFSFLFRTRSTNNEPEFAYVITLLRNVTLLADQSNYSERFRLSSVFGKPSPLEIDLAVAIAEELAERESFVAQVNQLESTGKSTKSRFVYL